MFRSFSRIDSRIEEKQLKVNRFWVKYTIKLKIHEIKIEKIFSVLTLHIAVDYNMDNGNVFENNLT